MYLAPTASLPSVQSGPEKLFPRPFLSSRFVAWNRVASSPGMSIDEGDATKRVAIGFGSGASQLSVAVEGFQVTAQGLRKLGSGNVDAGGGKTPGGAVGVAALIVTGNPVGLIVGGGAKAYGEYSGSSKIEGRAKAIAKEIAYTIRPKFQAQGWIQ